MKRFLVLLLVVCSFLVADAFADGFTSGPASTATPGAVVNVTWSATYGPYGSGYPPAYLNVWIKPPGGSYSRIQLTAGTTGTVQTSGCNYTFPSGPMGAWTWCVSQDLTSSPSSPTTILFTATTTLQKFSPSVVFPALAATNVGGSVSMAAYTSGGSSPTGAITYAITGTSGGASGHWSGNTLIVDSLSTGNPGTITVTATYPGDATNNSATASQTVNVPNRAPTASGSGVATITVGQNYYFNISGSDSDSNLTSLTMQVAKPGNGWQAWYTWSFSATNSASNSFYWTCSMMGTYNFQVCATDASGATSAWSQTSVVVQKASPSVSFPAVANTYVGQSVGLSATVSGGYNPTGSITYSVVSTAGGATGYISGNSLVVTGLGSGNPGTITVRATYPGDGNNNSTTSDQVVSIPNRNCAVNYFTIDGAASGKTIVVGQTTSLAFQATDPDGNLCYQCFLWDQGSGMYWTGNNFMWNYQNGSGWSNISAQGGSLSSTWTNTITANWTGYAPGTYQFLAYVVDDNWNTSASTQYAITVIKASPSVSFPAPSNTYVGASVGLSASVSGGYSPSGGITYSIVGTGGGANGYISGNTLYVTALTTGNPGTITVRATYGGDSNNNSTYADQTVSVPNRSPTCSFTLDRTTAYVGDTITATITANDQDGNLDFTNLWVATPNIGWRNIHTDNSLGSVNGNWSRSDTATSYGWTGTTTRTFTVPLACGFGTYTFQFGAVDLVGVGVPTANQTVTVIDRPPTVSLTVNGTVATGGNSNTATSVSNHSTLNISYSGADPDGNYASTNIWVSHGASSNPNLLTNSSFEGTYNGYGIYNNTAGTEPTTQTYVTGREGQALQISWSNPNQSSKGIYFNGPNGGKFATNQDYIVSCWIKASGSAVGQVMTPEFNHCPDVMTTLADPPLTTGWQRYAWLWHWNTGSTVDVNGFISINYGAPVSGSLTFDDVMVNASSTLVPYNNPEAVNILSSSSASGSTTYYLNDPGTYTITSQSSDSASMQSGVATVTIASLSNPPQAATPTGPTSVTVGQSGTYTFSATDTDGDMASMETYFADPTLAYGVSNNWWPNRQDYPAYGSTYTATRTFTFTQAGVWQAAFRVSDSSGWYTYWVIGQNNWSPVLNITVNKASPTVSFNAISSTYVGQGVTLSASPSGGYNPTGSISYSITGSTGGATGSITGNTLNITGLGSGNPGTLTITATYPGDGNNNSATATQTVNVPDRAPTITGSATPTSIIVGQNVGFSMTGSDQDSNLTSIVIQYQKPSDIGSNTWNVWNTWNFSATNSSAQSTTYAATSQAGTWGFRTQAIDASGLSSAWQPYYVTVNKASPTVTFPAIANTYVGQSVPLTASTSGGYSPTGTITYSVTGSSGGAAGSIAGSTLTITALGAGNPGTLTITATYPGDANNNSATNTATVNIPDRAPTATIGGGIPSWILLGAGISVTATATDADGNMSAHNFIQRGPRTTSSVADSLGWTNDTANMAVWSALANPGIPTGGASSSKSAVFTPNAGGYWQVGTTATDSSGQSSAQSTSAVIFAAPPVSFSLSATASSGPSANGGGSITIYPFDVVTLSSTASSTGWLSAHNLGFFTGAPTPTPPGNSTPLKSVSLSAASATTSSSQSTTWTPGLAGTYTLYAEAFTGRTSLELLNGLSGYPGYFGGATDHNITVTVQKYTTSVNFTAIPDTYIGQSRPLSATVVGGVNPTGAITYSIVNRTNGGDGTIVGTTFTATGCGTGSTVTIRATYPGDGNHLTSFTDVVVNTTRVPTTTSLTSSNPSFVTVNFTTDSITLVGKAVSVVDGSTVGTPTYTVASITYLLGSSLTVGGPVSTTFSPGGVVVNSDGSADAGAASATIVITASYAGSATMAPSQTTITLTVVNPTYLCNVRVQAYPPSGYDAWLLPSDVAQDTYTVQRPH